jgi:hypothetical protein
LPAPDILAAEIADELEAAFDLFVDCREATEGGGLNQKDWRSSYRANMPRVQLCKTESL